MQCCIGSRDSQVDIHACETLSSGLREALLGAFPHADPLPPHLAVASVYARTRVLATALRIPDDKFPVDPNGVLTAQTELPNYVSKVVCFYVDLYFFFFFFFFTGGETLISN